MMKEGSLLVDGEMLTMMGLTLLFGIAAQRYLGCLKKAIINQ
jgi:hypothetical protein